MSRLNVSGANLPPTDIPGAQPIAPPRLEITNLIKDDKQWSLYIQALILFQHIDPAKPLSWFAISGIHAYPLDTQWENAGAKTGYGYCVHGLPHFPTWHRPYLALYEQALQAAALEVAKKYTTDTSAWVNAALTLRSPYWDWADPWTYLPPPQVYDSVKYKNLRITTPEGSKDLPNPLLAYTFQRKINWRFQDPTTVRHPRKTPAASIKAFEDDVRSNAVNGNLQFACWKTLNWTRTWLEFSNQGATQGQRANSLETLHNWIHTRTGGAGHMSDPISSGFDPIFMLHHTNVDRQLALWQALHPETWISGSIAKRDLVPFWKSKNEFHRSNDDPVRNLTQFGATYPEFVGLENSSAAERQARIQAQVNFLYDPDVRRRGIAATGVTAQANVASLAGADNRQAPAAASGVLPPTHLKAHAEIPHSAATGVTAQASVVSLAGADNRQALAAPTDVLPATHLKAHAENPHSAARAVHAHATPSHATPTAVPGALTALQRLDWFIRIRVKKFQLKQSFSILVFLGQVPDDVAQWRSSPNLVGNHSEFVNSNPNACASCQENIDMITEGFIDLDSSLERMGYGHKNEKEIEKVIRHDIHWRVQKIDGTVVPATELDVLEIAVMTWDVTNGDLDVRPVHRNVTSDRVGGRVPGRKPYDL